LDNAELTGRFSVITGDFWLGIAEVLQVERLVPEAQSAEEPNGRPGTGQLGVPAVRSAVGTPKSAATGELQKHPQRLFCRLNFVG